ncbi:MAG: uridine kinase [Candidatus Xenobia bacterium]
MTRELLIGVAGGTGSGKTTVADQIVGAFPEGQVLMLAQDAYYKDQAHLPWEQRVQVNYDHPDAFDSALLISHLNELMAGHVVQQPIYDFKTHTRSRETTPTEPRAIIIVEGILMLWEASLRSLLDIKIYVETDADERFIRRLTRDIAERGRTVESVITQYQSVVRPMHLQFVEPSKRYADVIIPYQEHNPVAVDLVVSKIKSLLAGL